MGIVMLHLITYFFAAGSWPHSVDTNYVCNLLCCVFWRSSKIKITLCHTVLISISTFIIVTPTSVVGPKALRFFKGFKPYPMWTCFHGVGRRCSSGSETGGTPAFMAWRWSSRDNLISAIPLGASCASSMKHTDKPGGTHTVKHCDTYQLFTVTIPLLLLKSFPGLCCDSSHKALKFAHLALTANHVHTL